MEAGPPGGCLAADSWAWTVARLSGWRIASVVVIHQSG